MRWLCRPVSNRATTSCTRRWVGVVVVVVVVCCRGGGWFAVSDCELVWVVGLFSARDICAGSAGLCPVRRRLTVSDCELVLLSRWWWWLVSSVCLVYLVCLLVCLYVCLPCLVLLWLLFVYVWKNMCMWGWLFCRHVLSLVTIRQSDKRVEYSNVFGCSHVWNPTTTSSLRSVSLKRTVNE